MKSSKFFTVVLLLRIKVCSSSSSSETWTHSLTIIDFIETWTHILTIIDFHWNCNVYQMPDEVGLKWIWTKSAAPQRICKMQLNWFYFRDGIEFTIQTNRQNIRTSSNQKFGRKAFSSHFTFSWSFRQNEAFVAVRTLHGGEISSELCDIGAPWAPGDQVFEDCNLSVWGSPALEVPLLLNALFPLDQPHHRGHIVDGNLLPLLNSLPRP